MYWSWLAACLAELIGPIFAQTDCICAIVEWHDRAGKLYAEALLSTPGGDARLAVILFGDLTPLIPVPAACTVREAAVTVCCQAAFEVPDEVVVDLTTSLV
jgi:hypothetical protein